jgi:hypothetical protein
VFVLLVAGCAPHGDGEAATGCGDLGDDHANHGGDVTQSAWERNDDGRWRRTVADVTEVSDIDPTAPVTAEQQRAVEAFAAKVCAFAGGMVTKDDAFARGYVYDEVFLSHVVHPQWLDDGITLDPSRPEFVMFNESTGLVEGVMFLAQPDERGQQFGGPSTIWHFHSGDPFDDMCWRQGSLQPRKPDPVTGQCTEGETRPTTPEMLHFWFGGGGPGQFAT